MVSFQPYWGLSSIRAAASASKIPLLMAARLERLFYLDDADKAFLI